MKRRRFIALLGGAGLIWPLVARAQETGKYYRIAIVHPVRRVADMSEEGDRIYRAFFSELRRLGYVEGKNLIVERRSAEGHTGHYPDLTQDVVQLRPNVICASSTQLVSAFKAATTTIPIIGVTDDPIASGLAASLARPGGNITGFSVVVGEEIFGKYLELLRLAADEVLRVGFLLRRAAWEDRYGRSRLEIAQRAGLTLIGAPLSDPIQEPEYRRVFAALASERVQAVIVSDNAENLAHHKLIVALAAQARIPAIYPFRDYAIAGGLMVYGFDVAELWLGVARYVDQILRGANPGELPYQQPTKFELVINLKTAKALGLTLPQSLLARADEVIE
ncbi:MAG: ABC transporter substrate-binding protein [Alphaproteobacteria bacterium]|nr:MAG: ABC transporter substrate-binding protein [Alphaproteobacteria bacterium]